MFKQGLLILLLPSLSFQGTGEKAVIEREWKSLQGKWLLEVIEVGGAKVKPDFKIWAVVGHEEFTMTNGRGKEVLRMTIKPRHSPKLLDWHEPGPAGRKSEGIYELGNDRLRICISGIQNIGPRPTEFRTRKGDRLQLLNFQRMKE